MGDKFPLNHCLLWFEELSSTQDYLKERPNLNCTVIAKRQKSGRGRYGREWESQEGGLYFSFPLKEGIRDEGTLPLVISLSVAELLEGLGILASIKWINDVYVRGKKISGVLIEKVKGRLIVGIGLNVNQKGFSEGLEATSLYLVSQKEHDLRDIFLRLMGYIHKNLDVLEREGFNFLRPEIKRRLLFLGQEVILYTEPPTLGILHDLSERGELILLTAEGEKRFTGGEVSLRALG